MNLGGYVFRIGFFKLLNKDDDSRCTTLCPRSFSFGYKQGVWNTKEIQLTRPTLPYGNCFSLLFHTPWLQIRKFNTFCSSQYLFNESCSMKGVMFKKDINKGCDFRDDCKIFILFVSNPYHYDSLQSY